MKDYEAKALSKSLTNSADSAEALSETVRRIAENLKLDAQIPSFLAERSDSTDALNSALESYSLALSALASARANLKDLASATHALSSEIRWELGQ